MGIFNTDNSLTLSNIIKLFLIFAIKKNVQIKYVEKYNLANLLFEYFCFKISEQNFLFNSLNLKLEAFSFFKTLESNKFNKFNTLLSNTRKIIPIFKMDILNNRNTCIENKLNFGDLTLFQYHYFNNIFDSNGHMFSFQGYISCLSYLGNENFLYNILKNMNFNEYRIDEIISVIRHISILPLIDNDFLFFDEKEFEKYFDYILKNNFDINDNNSIISHLIFYGLDYFNLAFEAKNTNDNNILDYYSTIKFQKRIVSLNKQIILSKNNEQINFYSDFKRCVLGDFLREEWEKQI